MHVIGLLLPLHIMWAWSTSCLFQMVRSRPESTLSDISRVLATKEPNSLFYSSLEAQSPGTPIVPVDKQGQHHQDMNMRTLIVSVAASTLLGLIILSLSCFCIYRLKKLKNDSTKGTKAKQNPDTAKGHPRSPVLDRLSSLRTASRRGPVAVMEYQLLEAATNKFSKEKVLGQGAHALVYKACLNDELTAAVKKLDVGFEREFENELHWLTKLWHRNIVSLLGYCIHGETRFLVYEMMQNGSLESQLHGPTKGSALTWHLRVKVAVDIARGLEYLHEHCNPPVIHRDLKSANILLDSEFNAKLSRFGLAVSSGIQNKNIKLSGTVGYVAPECFLDGKLTDKSDVYAFGVFLLELLTGRKPVERMPPDRRQSLVSWAMPQLTDRSKLPNIVDPVIKDTMDPKHLYQVAAVAVLCIQQEPGYRPLITDVLHSLIPLVPLELGGSLRITEPLRVAALTNQ